MNYYLLTANPLNNPAMLKATDAIINNGHHLVDNPQDADIVLVSDDITAKVKVIMNYKNHLSRPESYSSWSNFLAREFF